SEVSLSLLFHGHVNPRALHSFPTRRSSDLLLSSRERGDPYTRAPQSTTGESHNRAPAVMGPRVRGDDTEGVCVSLDRGEVELPTDRKSTRLNSSHVKISYAVFCLKQKSTTG